jgi:hypothetical protein
MASNAADASIADLAEEKRGQCGSALKKMTRVMGV